MKKLFLILCAALVFGGPIFIANAALEDTQHVSGDGTLDGSNIPMTVRQSSAAALAGSNLDYQPLSTDANGNLYVIQGAVPAGTTSVTVQAGTVAVSILQGTSSVTVQAGTVAVSSLAGGTVAVSILQGTSFTSQFPTAAVTRGVGVKTVSTSGTSLRLSSQAARIVKIKANEANTNAIYVVPGGTTATDYSSTANPGGYELGPGDTIELPVISNLDEIVIDSTTNAEGINYAWIGY